MGINEFKATTRGKPVAAPAVPDTALRPNLLSAKPVQAEDQQWRVQVLPFALLVHLFAVADANNQYDKGLVLQPADDAIVPNPIAPQAGKLSL